MADFDGAAYQARFNELAATGVDVHGEATLVRSFRPSSVLDAGCGTGRVAIELARHGIEVVGVDVEDSMLAEARRRGPGLVWLQADLARMELGRQFDAVVLAGNVPLFCPVEDRASLLEACAAHVQAGGVLISGFELGRGVELEDYDAACTQAGVTLLARWSTWDRSAFLGDSTYAVSVHAR